ncbi:hypothetical protein PHMEG_00012947 [Phytophthora megakarya]|uniref:Uncharacterized protein n=1 Tax=Phytophthora megakarya TaxID=4795 RepID=A0A225W8H2_9STRA|nr:hypothetical protein PHMEG_00012947 [Phytophthora megakarya]
MSTNDGDHIPNRAFAHPSPHSGSSRKRIDSSSTTTSSKRRHSRKTSISVVEKSPTQTICNPPNGTPGTLLNLRSSLSSLSHSDLINIDTSSITSTSTPMKSIAFDRSNGSKKLASVLLWIYVAAFPVKAVLSTQAS